MRWLWVIGVGCVACSGEGVSAHDAGVLADGDGWSLPEVGARAVPTCASREEAPVRGGASIEGFTCVAVGPMRRPSMRWPDRSAVTGAIVWVDPTATAGGDGSEARPFATLAEALPRSTGHVFLAAGTHVVTGGLALPGGVSLRGVGAVDGSVVEMRGTSARLRVETGSVVVEDLSLRAGPEAPEALLSVSGGRATLRDVSFVGGREAIVVDGGSVRGERVSVQRTTGHGVLVRGGGEVGLDTFVVRAAGLQGIRVEAGRLSLRRGIIADNVRHGAVLIGAAPTSPMPSACEGFPAFEGARDCIDEVVFDQNGVAGLFVSGPRRVDVRHTSVLRTRLGAVDNGVAGDGIALTAGAQLYLDDHLRRPEELGLGSLLMDNERAGMVLQSQQASATVRGAVFRGNQSGAIVLGSGGVLRMLGESLLTDNGFGGLVATPGSTVGIVQCNGIAATHEGTLQGTAGTVRLADGIHLNATQNEAVFNANIVVDNVGFGLLVNAARATLLLNRGSGNRFGIGDYNGALLTGDVSSIRGREAQPTLPPTLVMGL